MTARLSVVCSALVRRNRATSIDWSRKTPWNATSMTDKSLNRECRVSGQGFYHEIFSETRSVSERMNFRNVVRH